MLEEQKILLMIFQSKYRSFIKQKQIYFKKIITNEQDNIKTIKKLPRLKELTNNLSR